MMAGLSNIALTTHIKRPAGFNILTDLNGTLEFLGRQDYTITSSPDVDSWNDESGNGNDATQGTAAAKPHQSLSAVNGYNALDFDGTDDYFNAGLTYQAMFRTMWGGYFVVRPDDGQPAALSRFFGVQNVATGHNFIQCLLHTSGDLRMQVDDNANNQAVFVSSLILPDGVNAPQVFFFVCNTTAGFLQIYRGINGTFTQLSDNGVNTGSLTGVNITTITLARNPFFGCLNENGTATTFFNGLIAEAGLISVITQQDIDNIGASMVSKYNL